MNSLFIVDRGYYMKYFNIKILSAHMCLQKKKKNVLYVCLKNAVLFSDLKKMFLFCLSHLDCIAGPGAKKKSKPVKETKKKGKPKKSKSKAGQSGKRKKGSSVRTCFH